MEAESSQLLRDIAQLRIPLVVLFLLAVTFDQSEFNQQSVQLYEAVHLIPAFYFAHRTLKLVARSLSERKLFVIVVRGVRKEPWDKYREPEPCRLVAVDDPKRFAFLAKVP